VARPVSGVRICTWNVNSLRARLPRVLELLEKHVPDVVLLQETKVSSDQFPGEELRAAGYDAVHHSGGQWAGVAILARSAHGLTAEVAGLPGELRGDEARWIEADVPGLGVRVASVYVVNGRAVGSPTFDEKLAFLDAMARRAGELRGGPPLMVGGDVNVAPADEDVYDPAAFAGATHVTPEERGRLAAVMEAGGLVDAYLRAPSGDHRFTWWDYRAGHFHKNLGLRIDLLMISSALADGLRGCGIDRDLRKGQKPSDHAPLLAEVALSANG
jgi:exodeoxyribonuclease-3